MNKRTVAFHNLGCKVNLYETEAVLQSLKSCGYEIVPFEPGADIYIINTCSVTNMADKKSRQMIHRAKKLNPEAIVVAMGCYVQAKADAGRDEGAADIVVGNNRKNELPEILREYELRLQQERYIDDLSRCSDYERLSISATTEHIRGFMKVQDGCNQFCSYCIIPYVRGRIRSRSLEDAIKEAKRLAQSGCKEVVLSGIHLSSYGMDLDEDTNLLALIKAVHDISEIKRIRIGSLEPGIITDDFASALSELPKFAPHFHLSLQSGCDKTLKAMNRRYTTAEYADKCEILRRYFENPALTTDVITGFPGETKEDFEETCAFVDGINFFETHIFPYSKRQGTRAAAMPGQLTEAVKKERAGVLIALSSRKKAERLKKLKGAVKAVLFEEEQLIDGKSYWVGHTKEYERIAVPADESLKNTIANVKITGMCRDDCALGEILG